MSFEAASTGGDRTITAFFDSRSDADNAVERLVAAGISRSGIRLVPGQSGTGTTGSTSSYSSGNEGGFWDSLKDLFLPDEDRHTYAEGLSRGGYLVSVSTSAANYDTALDILDDEGTIDINERESSWRSEGWTGYSGAPTTAGLTGTSGLGAPRAGTSGFGTSTRSDFGADAGLSRSSELGTDQVIPVAEEELRIGKRDVSHGRVRVRSYVVETPVSEQVSLREENVHIERRPVDRAATGEDRLWQDRTIDLEERAEEAVVAKETRVREELVINKDVNQHTETVSDTVRHTEVDVEDERDTDLTRRANRTI